MPEEDSGWAGSWEPMIIDAETLQKVRDVVGQSKQHRDGKTKYMCGVNLQTGEVTY